MPSRLERSRITGDKLFLYTAKTGTPVYVPLPDFVLTALEAVPKISEQYFFWSGESKRESATGDWQRALKGVFKEAKIPDGHAHRFRDTFAVGLLQAGVPMDRVSVVARTQQHQGDGEALFAVGASPPGAVGGGC